MKKIEDLLEATLFVVLPIILAVFFLFFTHVSNADIDELIKKVEEK